MTSLVTRRQFLVRSGLALGAATVLPSLLPTCKECGDRLIVELLHGERDLCASCRAKHATIYTSANINEWPSGLTEVMTYTSVHEINSIWRKIQGNIAQSIQVETAEWDWLERA